jgi:hypothetical protein
LTVSLDAWPTYYSINRGLYRETSFCIFRLLIFCYLPSYRPFQVLQRCLTTNAVALAAKRPLFIFKSLATARRKLKLESCPSTEMAGTF